MTEQERREAERMAMEAERLRNDEAFQHAILNADATAKADLAQAEKALSAAVLARQDTGPAEDEVRRQMAKIDAISALTTEIAALIIRGKPRVLKPVA